MRHHRMSVKLADSQTANQTQVCAAPGANGTPMPCTAANARASAPSSRDGSIGKQFILVVS